MSAPTYWDPLDLADDRLAAGFAGMALRRAKALEAGAEHVGWKVGINDIGFRERLGIGSGVAGWLTDRTRHDDGHVPVDGASAIGVEIEVAFVMGDGGTVAALAPAIEVVDIVGGDIESAMARDVWHHAFVLGPSTPWRDGLVGELVVTADHDGESFDVPAPVEDKLADVDGMLRFAAEGARALGGSLEAGDVILSGNLIPSLRFAKAGSTVTARIEPLGEVVVELGQP
jgi:2-oxo-3-hexenedioate decarboxylase